MRRSIFALFGASALVAGAAFYAQTHAQTSGSTRVNVGSLVCTVAAGDRIVPGSEHHLDCLFARSDGTAEPYLGDIKRFGRNEVLGDKAPIVWQVFAAGTLAPGALDGDFGKAGGSAHAPDPATAASLVDGKGKRIALRPARVAGRAGINIAEGVADLTLQHGS
ncbi:Protein of unknown function [Enhydrobacter aerosaccus]|uniref:DUF992 domain-containing protein n=1 Tax=Enhydrobacter aerosaccus TaxID=225324 RepID=A0A1T4JK17_9HYPH|nr:DUF992 domain-containing protein [Enhydrobacter aerosaccus]SJZ30407.1 Protein of unknown function [Enhydrobacter aerosaccus]